MRKPVKIAFGILIAAIAILAILSVMPPRRNAPTAPAASPPTVGDDQLAALVIRLGDADAQRRAAAEEQLKKIGQPALPYLQRAFNSVSEDVRKRLEGIIQALGGAPPPSLDDQLAALVIQLADADAARRAAAIEQLKKIGRPALPYLERAIQAVGEEARKQLQPIIVALGGQLPQNLEELPLLPAPLRPELPPDPDLPEPTKYRLVTKETLVAAGIPSAAEISPVISPDGKHVAFSVLRGATLKADEGNQRMVIDGRIGMDFTAVGRPVFSPDSKRVAYTATVGLNSFIVAGDWQSKLYRWTGEPRFSPDSKRVAFAAEVEAKQVMVVGEEAGKPYRFIHSTPLFSPDGRRLAYVARQAEKQFVVVDGREGADFDWIGEMVFSPDSRRFAYLGASAGNQVVVADGEPANHYDEVGNIVFSPDGARLAHWARRGAKWFVVENGVEAEACERLAIGPYFSPDGKHTAYAATRGAKVFLVRDGEQTELPYQAVAKGTPLFSPDSKRLAFAGARDGKYFVVVDGREGKPYDGIGCLPVFSRNSRHVAYLAQRHKKWVVVVNELETAAFDGFPIGAKIVFETSRSLHVMILRGSDFYLLDINLVPDDGGAPPQ
jgi:Tol biopolymer transport system component